MPAHSLLFSKCTMGAARLNVPIRRTNRYQQYYMPSQHTYCGRVWNLIQDCDIQSSDQKVYISIPPSPEVENFQIKIYYPAGDRTPNLLNQRQTCYHLSQRGELFNTYKTIILPIDEGTPWRQRLDVRLTALGSRIRVSVTPCGFRAGRNGVIYLLE